ncbi:MAG: HIT domain-containing protein [Bacillota bacterium]|nr:HIT domain-containing protein [Bacillota bacterium]
MKNILDEKFKPAGYNIGVNIGKTLGQTIFHLYYHIIPCYIGDVVNLRGQSVILRGV